MFALLFAALPIADPVNVARSDLDRFHGALMALDNGNALNLMSEYRKTLKKYEWRQEEWIRKEIAYAHFAWDAWDDLRIAAKEANTTFALERLKRKIGNDAYLAGEMPAIPDGAFFRWDGWDEWQERFDKRDWQEMPKR